MDLTKNLKVSAYKEITITLVHKYPIQYDDMYCRFDVALYPLLTAAGFVITKGKRDDSPNSEDVLTSRENPLTNVIVYPTELCGFATMEDAEQIYKAVTEFKRKYPDDLMGIGDLRTFDAYELSDEEYRKLLCDNTNIILLELREFQRRDKNCLNNFVDWFLLNYRVNRVGFNRRRKLGEPIDKVWLTEFETAMDKLGLVRAENIADSIKDENGWIPVSSGVMPDTGEKVQITYICGGMPQCGRYGEFVTNPVDGISETIPVCGAFAYIGNDGNWYWAGEDDRKIKVRVTAWRRGDVPYIGSNDVYEDDIEEESDDEE